MTFNTNKLEDIEALKLYLKHLGTKWRLDWNCNWDDTTVLELILIMCKGSLEQLHIYSSMELLGNYYRLSKVLIEYKEGIDNEAILTEDEKEYLVTTLLWAIATSLNEKTLEPYTSISEYIDELLDLIEYLIPEFECPYIELLLGTNLLYREYPYTDLLSNEGISLKDKEGLLSNFIHMKDLRDKQYLLSFYENLIRMEVLLPITQWEGFKALLLNLNPVDVEWVCDYVEELYDMELEDYQIEFLLELGYAPDDLLERAYKSNLHIPNNLKHRLYGLELSATTSHIQTTKQLIEEWNQLSSNQREYVLKHLRYTSDESNSYIQLGVLPLFIHSVDVQLIDVGITDFEVCCTNLKLED